MSRGQAKKSASAAARKQRQRAKLRASGKTKQELWISSSRRKLLNEFALRAGLRPTTVGEMVMEYATPLYLREIQRRIDLALPLLREVLKFEKFGVPPVPSGFAPVRIGTLALDPKDHFEVRERLEPILVELSRYGVPREMLRKMVQGGSAGAARDRRKPLFNR